MNHPYEQEIGVGVPRCPHIFGHFVVEHQPRTREQFAARHRAAYAARLRGAGWTYAAIGGELGVSVERARQLVHRAWGRSP